MTRVIAMLDTHAPTHTQKETMKRVIAMLEKSDAEEAAAGPNDTQTCAHKHTRTYTHTHTHTHTHTQLQHSWQEQGEIHLTDSEQKSESVSTAEALD
jgi:hypothetical protein